MTAELGLFFLILALLTSLLQASFLLPLPGLRKFITACLIPAVWLQALCLTLAFALLMVLRLDSDFSVIGVAANSNLTLPVLYKIVGTWGNHQGSMLLWVWVLAVFGAAFAFRPMPHDIVIKMFAVAVQSALCAGFLLLILFRSNPFARHFPPPLDGIAPSPVLQDFTLSIYPPLLYLGDAGFSILFSLVVAALIQGTMQRSWVGIMYPWILASWSVLTIGMALGSWRTYHAADSGGFRFWNPMENVSLIPWLCGTALLHSNMALKKASIQQWIKKRGYARISLPVFLSHLGVALLIAGVTGASVWKEEVGREISVGDTIKIAGYHLTYDKQFFEDTTDYHTKHGRFRVTDSSGKEIATLRPEFRTDEIRKMVASVAAIYSTFSYDLYAIIGESSTDGERTATHIYYNPLINLIWIGCLLMALGGIAGIIIRRKI